MQDPRCTPLCPTVEPRSPTKSWRVLAEMSVQLEGARPAEEVTGRLEVALGGGQAKVVVARVVRAVLRVVAVVARAAVGRVEVLTAAVRVGNQAGAKAVAERATVVAERAMVVAAKVMESLGVVPVGKEVDMMALVAVARTAAARVTRRLAQSSWLLC